MPQISQDSRGGKQALGAMVLFRRGEGKFSQLDFDLVEAASSQIALVARQAEYYASEKRQANSLAALYRLSHELSKVLTPREVAEHAIPIIQEELACKRMWLGVLNEQGTHLIGQGGFGPGVRRPIIEMQIELDLQHDFLDEAMLSKKAVVVREGERMECSGLNRLVQKLKLGTFVIVPLVSLGQVVGVLVVEPAMPSTFFVQRRLPLLSSMASEMATVILARRFESKMADADKMRMAGLLASGVAHNFNNLLQAVMGQASLIEMQLPADSPLATAARTIVDAAGKGAGLIKQMLTLTRQGSVSYQIFSVNDLVRESTELYRSLIGPSVAFDVELVDNLPQARADYGQIQQVLTNLVVNAKEALGTGEGGEIRIATRLVTLASGEVDPELSPGEYLRIDVIDNGVGMDEEGVARCFEPFYTTKNVDSATGIGFDGTGLGLSLGYSILKQHEGLLTVRSAVGEGSVFSLYLPTYDPGRRERSLSRGESRDGRGRKVVNEDQLQAIVLDIDDSVHFSVRSTLESLGFDVQVISDESGLRELFQSEVGGIDMLILDLDAVSESARELITGIKTVLPTLRVVGATLHAQKWEAALKFLDGVHVVEKPLGVWAIHSVVRNLVYGTGRSKKLADSSAARSGAGDDRQQPSRKEEDSDE